MKAQALWIVEPGRAELRSEELPPLAADHVLIETEVSAFSPGTERLFFEGKIPDSMPVDSHLPGLGQGLEYPLKYGYSCVGRVVERGENVHDDWVGQRVFAFHPHQSHFHVRPEEVVALQDEIKPARGVFLPNAETAVSLLHDGAPLTGERVVVHGLGVVGQLITTLLAEFPLERLLALDPLADRRDRALARGVHACLDPTEPEAARRLSSLLGELEPTPGADLSFELSGAPAALQLAVATTAFSGRIVVGSWYGSKSVALKLGGRFHRSRMQLISSQVSTVNPSLSGRWTKDRRLAEAVRLLPNLRPEELITHRVPFGRATDAYDLLAPGPERLAVLLLYGESE